MSYPCKIKIELTDVDNITTVASKTFDAYTPNGELESIAEFFNNFMKAADFSFFNKDTVFLCSLTEDEHRQLLERLTVLRKEKDLIKDANFIESCPANTDEYIFIKFYYKNEKTEVEYETSDVVQINAVQTIFKLLYNFIQLTGLQTEQKGEMFITKSLTYKEMQSLKKYISMIRDGKI